MVRSNNKITYAEKHTKKFSSRRNGDAILALVESQELISLFKIIYKNNALLIKLLSEYEDILKPFYEHYQI